ncbi:MAG: hypothetical protein VW440_07315 [Bordetella sp.]
MAELAQTINKANEPLGFSRIAAEKSPIKRSQMARQAQPEILRQESEARRQKSEAEIGAKRRQVEEEAQVEERFAAGMGEANRQLQGVMDQAPVRRVEDFDPNAGLELAAMTALLGAFAGSVSGQAALTSMKGITEGYRAGKQDLYERSVKEFESELQAYKDKVSNAKSVYEMAMKEEAARRGAGIARLKAFAPELQDSVAAAHLRVDDLKSYGSAIKEMEKLGEQMSLKAFEAGIKPKTLAPRLTTVEGVDESGKTVPLVVDVNAEGFNPSNVKIGAPGVIGKAPPKAAQAGVRERSFALRTFTALVGVVQDFKNLLDSPETAAMPAFSGIIASDPNTVLGSLTALAARDMTTEDERAFQQLSEQIAASLARIEAQGLASGTTQANIRSFDALRPKAGDKAINMALYLARLKQEIDIGLKVFETNAGANQQQFDIIKQLKDEVDGLLPYDVDDVLKILPGGQRSLSQSTQALMRQPALFGTIVDNQPESSRPAGQTPREGDKSTSRSGRPIIFRNGEWEYE